MLEDPVKSSKAVEDPAPSPVLVVHSPINVRSTSLAVLALLAFALKWCVTGKVEWRGTSYSPAAKAQP